MNLFLDNYKDIFMKSNNIFDDKKEEQQIYD